MPRTLDADQAEKAARDHLHPITLVVLTTYTDRLSLTVDKKYHLADHSLKYRHGTGAIDTFLPVIIGGRDFVSEMVHLPDASDGAPYRQRVEIGVTNLPIGGTRFIKTLQAHALEGATVEVSQLLVDDIAAGVMDHTALTGDEHTVLFRGRVNSVAPITETEFTLNCAMDLPSMGGESMPTDVQAWTFDGVSPWVAVASAAVALDTTVENEGTGCLKLSSDTGSTLNAMETSSLGPFDFRGKIASFDVRVDAGFFANMAPGSAFHLKISSNATAGPIAANYNTYLISDALITAATTWIRIYVDFARVPEDSAGTCDLTGIRFLQLGFTQVTGSNAEDVWFDDFRVASRDPSWLYSTDATITEPRDVGARWPMVYGQAKRVRCINHKVGWQTTLAVAITKTDTVAVPFTDLSGLPSGASTIRIGLEEMTATKIDQFTATLSNRGSNGTRARDHAAGEITIEVLAELIFGVAGHGCTAIRQVYLVNPATSELVRVPDLLFGADPFDSQFSPGRSVAKLSVSQEVIRGTLESLYSEVEVTHGATTTALYAPDVRTEQNQPTPKFYKLTTPQGALPRFENPGSPFQSNWIKCQWSNDNPALPDDEVVRWRMVITGNADQVASDGIGVPVLTMTIFNVPGFPDGHQLLITFPTGVTSSGVIGRSTWAPGNGALVSDLEDAVNGSYLHLWAQESGSFGQIDSGTWIEAVIAGVGLEAETTPAPPIPSFLGASVGFGLEVYADVDGYVAPDGNYTVAQGELIEHPADVLKHHIETYGESIDSGTRAALVTALGADAKFAGDIRTLGDDWAPILQRLAFEARANVIAEQEPSGREWKFLAASAVAGIDYGWGTATPSITEWQSFTDQGRAIEDLASSFLFHYQYDPTLAFPPTIQEDLFANTLVANKDVSDVPIAVADIDTEAKNFGAIAADPYTFLMIQDDATAQDTAGYLVQERMASARRVFEMEGVPWYQALPLVLGDLVNVTPPWDTASKLCRIISMRRGFFDHTWDITAVQVLAVGQHN